MSEKDVHILVVENEEAHAELIRRAFELRGGHVRLTLACNLGEARRCLREFVPDLVIADLLLPDGRGTELLPGEKEKSSYPVVVMTGHGDEQIAVEAMKAGALDYVVKSETTLADMPHLAEHTLREWHHITGRKRAEEALREERDRAQKYLDVAGAMFVLLDREGKVGLVNKKGCEILGYQESEILRHDWFDSFLPERIRDAVKEVFCKLMAGEIEPVEYYETPILTKNGQKRIIAWHNTVLKDDSGNAIGTLSSGQDITGRKKAEDALRESEERFRTLFESAPDAIYITDLEGRIIDGNKVAEDLCGYEKEQLTGRNFAETGLLSKEQLPKALTNLKKSSDGQSTGPDEFVLKKKDGSFVTLEIRTFPVKIGDDILVLGIGCDITERKKAEEALIEKEVTIRAIIETSQDWIWAIDLDGVHTYVNPAVERILGYPPEELIGRQSLNLMHEEDRKKIAKKLPQWKKEKSGWNNLVIRWRHKDGSYRYLESNAVPILDALGNLRGFRGVDRDITERKLAEQVLRDSEEKYRAIFEQAVDLIVLIDGETGALLEFNERVHEILGYTREEFRRLKIPDLEVIESSEEVDKHIKKIITEGADTFETRHRTKSGEIRNIRVSTRAISIGGKDFIQAIWRDITEQKRAEEKLLDYQAQLKSLASELPLTEERERRRLAIGLHDKIGQNLALTKLAVQSLMASVSGSGVLASLDEVCASIDKTIQDTSSLTFELSNPVLYELGFEAAVEQWLNEHIQKKCGIKYKFNIDGAGFELDNEISVVLFGAVRELLVNIVKHAKAETVEVGIRESDNRIKVTVADDGIGFDPSKLSLSSTKGKTGGFGLFSIRERLEYLGGEIEIKSLSEEGTCVILTAPLKR